MSHKSILFSYTESICVVVTCVCKLFSYKVSCQHILGVMSTRFGVGVAFCDGVLRVLVARLVLSLPKSVWYHLFVRLNVLP